MAVLFNDNITSEIQTGGGGIAYAKRVATVTEIPVGMDRDPHALIRALQVAGMPQIGDRHPSDPYCRVTQHKVRGVAGDQAVVEIIYERRGVSINRTTRKPTFLVARQESGVEMVSANILRGGGRAIPVSVSGEGVPSDLVVIQVGHPVRRLTIAGEIAPDTTNWMSRWRRLTGKVNDTRWRGLDAGHWRCDGASIEPIVPDELAAAVDSASVVQPPSLPNIGGDTEFTWLTSLTLPSQRLPRYRVAIHFTGRVIDDWRVTVVLRNQYSGKYFPVDDDDVDAALASPYEFGVKKFNGFSVVGPYRTDDFSGILQDISADFISV